MGALIFAAACSAVEHRPADLQLDILAELPVADATAVRLCPGELRERDFGPRDDGRFAMTGLPPGEGQDVVVDVLAEEGVLLRAEAHVDSWAEAEAQACEGCAPCGGKADRVPEGQESWVLAVRFLGEDA